MKVPLCEICLTTSGLCSGCSRKLAAGEVTEFEVSFSRLLAKLKTKLALEHVEVKRAFDCGNIAYIITTTSAGHLIGKGGKVVNALKKDLSKHVRVIQMHADKHRLVEEVLHPVKPLGFTTLYKAGAQVLKIRLPRTTPRGLPTTIACLQTVLTTLLNQPVEIVQESTAARSM